MATTRIPNDFKEFVNLLNSRGVEYLLVGGYAMALYGHARVTKDIDFWIRPTPENAVKVCGVIEEFGFSLPSGTQENLAKPNHMFRMGRSPVMIEVLTTISGVDFEPCYARKIITSLDGVPVNLISVEDFKINKLSMERGRDKDDVKILEGKA